MNKIATSSLSDTDLAYKLLAFVIVSRAVVEKFVEENSADGPLIRVIGSAPRILDSSVEMIEEMIDRAETAEREARKSASAGLA